LRALPCDVFLNAHVGYYGMVAKYERSRRGDGIYQFVDPEGYRAYVTQKEQAFRATLAAQRGAKEPDTAR
jgi:metallo-beta-lactamase class B